MTTNDILLVSGTFLFWCTVLFFSARSYYRSNWKQDKPAFSIGGKDEPNLFI